MTMEDAAIEWCRRERIDMDRVQGARVFWTARVLEPMSVAPAAPEWHFNGHVFKSGYLVCDNPGCCICRQAAVDHPCSSRNKHADSIATVERLTTDAETRSIFGEKEEPEATINGHTFTEHVRYCTAPSCYAIRSNAEANPCPFETEDVPF
ncbi:MAG: hypothetical protein WC911_02190 [Thermoleophilia bacterium]